MFYWLQSNRSTNSDLRWKSCKAWTPHVYHYNSCVHNTVHNPPYENKEHVPRETCNEWMCWMVKNASCQRMINSWSPLLNIMSRLSACMFTRNLEFWSQDRSRFMVVERSQNWAIFNLQEEYSYATLMWTKPGLLTVSSLSLPSQFWFCSAQSSASQL